MSDHLDGDGHGRSNSSCACDYDRPDPEFRLLCETCCCYSKLDENYATKPCLEDGRGSDMDGDCLLWIVCLPLLCCLYNCSFCPGDLNCGYGCHCLCCRNGCCNHLNALEKVSPTCCECNPGQDDYCCPSACYPPTRLGSSNNPAVCAVFLNCCCLAHGLHCPCPPTYKCACPCLRKKTDTSTELTHPSNPVPDIMERE